MLIAVLAAAVLPVSVSVAPVEVENLAPFVANRLTEQLAQELGTCVQKAEAAAPGSLAATDYAACYGAPSCLGSAGANLGHAKVVLGQVRHVAQTFELNLLVIDTQRRRAEKSLRERTEGRADELAAVARRGAQSVCEWLRSQATGAELALDDTPATPANTERITAATPLATPTLDLVVPDLPQELPLEPVAPVKPAEPPPAPPSAPTIAFVVPTPEPAPTEPPKPPPTATPTPVPPRRIDQGATKPPVLAKKPETPAWAMPNVELNARTGGYALAGVGAVTMLVGVGFGASAMAIRGQDRPVTTDGVVQHTLTRAEALDANGKAITANVLLGVGAAVAVAGGVVLWLVPAANGATVGGTF